MTGWWHSPLAALHPQGFTDQRHGDVMVVRPMRDYTAKEIAFYNRFFSVPTVIVPPLFTKVRGSRGGEPTLCVRTVGTGPPSAALPSLLAPTAPGEAQHPPAGRALPGGAAGGVPLHHQHRVQVWGGLSGGVEGLGCTHSPCVGCRTGEKLSPEPAKASSESQRCLLCLCGLDTNGGEWGGHWGAQGELGSSCAPLSDPLALTEEELALEPTLILEEPAAG